MHVCSPKEQKLQRQPQKEVYNEATKSEHVIHRTLYMETFNLLEAKNGNRQVTESQLRVKPLSPYLRKIPIKAKEIFAGMRTLGFDPWLMKNYEWLEMASSVGIVYHLFVLL